VNRRSFLKALAGGAVALTAGGIALLEAEPIRTYFMPPRCGWNAGSWELACAQEALESLNRTLMSRAPWAFSAITVDAHHDWVNNSMARRARLIERVDKLARGWTGYSVRRMQGPRGQLVTIHGGRSVGPFTQSGRF
jgi:hypothetical protein